MNPPVINPWLGIAEPVSCISHLLGALLSLVLGVALLRRGGWNLARLTSLLVFTLSCTFLFSMSGFYHLLEHGTVARGVLRRLDHAAIFLLIAGSFTPPHVIMFRGFMRWGVLSIIWALALLGVVFKTLFFEEVSEAVGLSFYLGLGWIGAFSALHLWWSHGISIVMPFVRPLYWGAIFYTGGATLEFFRWPWIVDGIMGPHELFHVAVLCGAACHFKFMHSIAGGVKFPESKLRRLERIRKIRRRRRFLFWKDADAAVHDEPPR
jgi:channel protein (hemolysin III family)